MRVAIFFDGKNYYAGWRAEASGAQIRLGDLARWLVARVEGTSLWGAYYYTGVEGPDGDPAFAEGSARLATFLSALSYEPGFFVRTFRRKVQTQTCSHCGKEMRFTVEKEVDTSMVADMLRLAAADAFDLLVLISGDADFTPAVDGVRALGKKVYVATWGTASLANRLRESAFDNIDLRDFLPSDTPAVSTADTQQAPAGPVDSAAVTDRDSVSQSGLRSDPEAFLLELRRAEAHFRGAYVGAYYFINRWRSDILNGSPTVRQDILNELEDAGQVEVYNARDGFKAVRIATTGDPAPAEPETDE